MKHRIAYLAVSAVIVAGLLFPVNAEGQARKSTATRPVGESSLLGVRLYDSGTRLIQMFGSPNEIQPVTFGGQAIGPVGGAGPQGGFGGPAGRPNFGGSAPQGGRGGGMGEMGADLQNRPWTPGDFSFESSEFRQVGPSSFGGPQGFPGAESAPGGRGGPQGAFGPPRGVPGGPGFPGGAPNFGPGGPGGPGAPAGGGFGANTNANRVTFTRWVYNRPGSKYAFILDRQNRVVQIEALGLTDGRVRTARGVTFGTTFGDIIRRYGAPDGYEIAGSNIVMRYLVRNKVAFRLSQLGQNKPHTVTGVVVAGGKM